jgi:hypothetical protein
MRLSVLGIIFFIFFAFGVPVYAHTTGASWTMPSDAYTVDIGYDPVTFTEGQYTRFDFLLWKGPANTGTASDFAQVWIRITKSDGDTVLATGIWKQPIGPTTLLYEFSEAGTYTIETSYRDKDGNDIAVASNVAVVRTGPIDPTMYVIAAGSFVTGVLLGLVAMLFLRKRRSA